MGRTSKNPGKHSKLAPLFQLTFVFNNRKLH